MRRSLSSSRGFTLIELLVVIVILGLLTLSSILLLSNYQENTRNAIRLNDLEEMRNAVERYRANNDGAAIADDSIKTLETLAPMYLEKFPSDPGMYSYQYVQDNTNSGIFFFGAKNELPPVDPASTYIKSGTSPMSIEETGTDGDSSTDPTNGIEFGF